MEIKINKEIRGFTESVFWGLSMRQFLFSCLAVGSAVLVYFLAKPYVGAQAVSWLCILSAVPFAAMGFFRYHGMTAEKFAWAWIRSELLEPRYYPFKSKTYYHRYTGKEAKHDRAAIGTETSAD